MALFGKKKQNKQFRYPGIRMVMDGNTAVVMCEREASDAAGAYPIVPSMDMSAGWKEQKNEGHLNISGRPLISISPEGEHSAAAITAGLSMTGLRATNFSSSQGIAYMHESLYAAVGKRLPYVLNIACRAMTKATFNIHAGHDDYHCMDDTGFIQIFAKGNQEVADLNIISRKIAELSLTPAAVAQDGFLTSHLMEDLQLPERALIKEFLGLPDDIIPSPTAAQRILYGEMRRRVPAIWDVDKPMMTGVVQNQDTYMQSVAGQRPYFFDHVAKLADECMDEWYELTGRRYHRIEEHRCDTADYLIIAQGSVVEIAEATATYLRMTRNIKVGVVNMTFFRPFPGDLISTITKGRKGITVMERTDQPLSEDLPLISEIRNAIAKAIENGYSRDTPFPEYATYHKVIDSSPLYSACFGLGSRDLQPEGIIAAVENMLPDGKRQKFFYLGIDFVRNQAYSPKQELQEQTVIEAYPAIRDLALKGSENPDLMPKDAITVRIHSISGYGAMTTGQHLAITLFNLFNYHIKASPKHGAEKKGEPTTYYLSAAPKPIGFNCEYTRTDIVIAADPNIFNYTNALVGLKKNGLFIIQSEAETPEDLWRRFSKASQQYIVDKHIKVAYLNGFKIAREETQHPDMQLRMQGMAFQGALFATSSIGVSQDKTTDDILQAIHHTLKSQFSLQDPKMVEENFRIVQRGFNEIQHLSIENMIIGDVATPVMKKEKTAPLVLLKKPANNDAPLSDIHRFFEQTGSNYINGRANESLADPFIALSIIPAATGIYKDLTQVRFEHPIWIPENCTACGDCYTACPDSAIPGLINSVNEVFETNITRIEKSGKTVKHLRRAIRTVEKKYHTLTANKSEGTILDPIFNKSIGETIKEYPDSDQAAVQQEFEWFKEVMGGFKFAITKPYHDAINKRTPNNGGLFSITINPMSCKGCMECVEVCPDAALEPTTQTTESISALRHDWDYWNDLPTSNAKYSYIDDLDEKAGALTTLLLDKHTYASMTGGDNSYSGSGEKTVVHLFTSTVTALMQPRAKKQIIKIEQLITGMEKHIRLKLSEKLDISDIEAVEAAIDANKSVDLTLTNLSSALSEGKASDPIDATWLKWVSQIVAKLKYLKWQYKQGPTGNGRVEMGLTNSTGSSSVWASTFPFNPYPFPWASHLFQDAPSLAMGIFEGHMVKMADGFKVIRMAELEIAEKYIPEEHEHFFKYFDWHQFSEEEYLLCPPIVTIGGDDAMNHSGFQNLSQSIMSGMPLKILILDTQVYNDNESPASKFGSHADQWQSIPRRRKEMGLISMAHRTTYTLQSSIAHPNHLIEGYIDGLNYRGPAIFNIYAVCQPEHGVHDNASDMQSRLAVEARAYPLMCYDPREDNTWEKSLSLKGNPNLDQDWTSYELKFVDEYGIEDTMTVPLTFADWAMTEKRFQKHFTFTPPSQWHDDMMPLHEFIDLDLDDMTNNVAYIHAVHPDSNTLIRVLISSEIVHATIERRDFWRTLKSLTGADQIVVDIEAVAAQAKAEMASSIASNLMSMAGGGDARALASVLAAPVTNAVAIPTPAIPTAVTSPTKLEAPPATSAASIDTKATPTTGGHEPVWIETPDCTTCDECVDINPKIFKYNEDKKAIIIDPTAGTFEDIVRSAEKCTAVIIHPGTPWNPNEKNLDKLIKRAEKFQ